jgi:hypothetical protein
MFAASKTSTASSGYQISRSLRFNSADSTYLGRTPSTASNRRTYTWSGWVKRSAIGVGDQRVFEAGASSSNVFWFGFGNDGSSDQFLIQDYSGGFGIQLATTPIYRDPSAWYHVVVAIDTTQATSTNRVKLYINGVQVTVFSTATYPSQNYDTRTNQTVAHDIGGSSVIGGSAYFNGYITEINFIDGSQLTPSSFGETNAQTGVWQPKAYSGSYGTNGFYLNFSDNSNTTAATLGKDYSGNGNNWTPNNFSVTAGAGNDSLVDSPTSYGTDTGVGGTVRGNYATLNPVDKKNGTLSNGNLNFVTEVDGSWNNSRGTIGASAGKFYWEMTATTIVGGSQGASIASPKMPLAKLPGQDNSFGVSYYPNGTLYFNGTETASWGSTWATGDIIGIALDMDSGKVWFAKNNTWQASGNPASGTNPARSDLLTADTTWMPITATYSGGNVQDLNFGARPFAYTAPSGFKALCTQNLPTPTIGATTATQAGKFFNPVLYTGNGSARSITGVGFQPDWNWIKVRNDTSWHNLVDAVRGVTLNLASNTTNAEATASPTRVTSFDADGFSLGTSNDVNFSGNTFVSWNWKANGSGSTNTSGSITSTVSANTTSGFSVVTYTGNAAAAATVGHGLGVTPAMVIVKSRNLGTEGWPTWHQSLGANTYWLRLNETIATNTNNTRFSGFSSTTFTLGVTANEETNGSGDTYVAYCFAEVAGYSKFGSFIGNASADGPFIYTGFRPAYIMLKRTDTGGYDWYVFDTKRNTYNLTNASLYPDLSAAEGVSSVSVLDILSNGFKMRGSSGGTNPSSGTMIYAAFAENPFKYSLAR